MDRHPQATRVADDAEVVVANVSPDDFAKLATMVRDDGGTVSGDDTGLVENPCFTATFRYDESARLLTLEPIRLMPGLKPRRLRKTVEQMLAPPLEPQLLDSGETIYKPTPHSCATYNWATGFFTNSTKHGLTYSASSTDHGDLDVKVSKIPAGTTPDSYQDGFWTNKGTKDSTLGCFGSISYQLDDGLTTLTVSYGVNTLSTTSASAALAGQNAGDYTATCTLYTEFYFAAAYIYPYVTLTSS